MHYKNRAFRFVVMALIQCNRCGSTVANIGKCPKCGALLCKECGHEVGSTDLKCPNCGKGTMLFQENIKKGIVCIAVGIMLMVMPFLFGAAHSSGAAFMNIVICLSGLVFLIIGIYKLAKYSKIKHFS